MNLRYLAALATGLMLLVGAGVATALASHSNSLSSVGANATTTCVDDQQGEDDQGGTAETDAAETDAAADIAKAAAEVDREAAREQADDENGDDQPGAQGDEQGENEDCD